jgi:MobA/VirD2-like, nuclease domain
VIAQVVRGNAMPDLVSYLFGPGRRNEHVNQHLVAGYADSVFTANDKLWYSEPGIQRHLRGEARELGWQVEYPRSRWQTHDANGYVWHCSLSLKAAEGQLTDAQWTQAAHALVDTLGFSGGDGKAPCRWIAVRHGLSKEGNDHIHVAVNLIREDGTKASTWNDYRKAGKACEEIEARFGLEHVPGRITHRSVPEPSRADREISAACDDPEPLRVRLERTVRACAAAAASEAKFVALARANGLLIRPRYATGTDRPAVTGYAVAIRNGRQARSRKTGIIGPIWFGGGKLASDLTLPALRRRWEPPGQNPATSRTQALAAWSAASTLDSLATTTRRPDPSRMRALARDPAAAAGLLAAAATACERAAPGPLSQAARHMARAVQDVPPAARSPEVTAVISDMASTFLAVTNARTGSALTLVNEVALLVDACVVRAEAKTAAAVTSETRKASVLVRAALGALIRAADRQARATLPIIPGRKANATKEITMTTLTHEEEFLGHLTAAGVLGARLFRTATGQSTGDAADVKALIAAGYTETTPFDDHLRRELGEQRWAWYVADPARIVCAALITDAAKAGHDIPALLAKACEQRAWEDDARSPAKSIARVLHYRIKQQMASPTYRRTHADPSRPAKTHVIRTASTASSAEPAPDPVPVTPWDDRLRELLGEHRWDQYAADARRRDVAAQLTTAAAEGHDIDALITEAVTCRDWEDDPTSPSRRVGSVLQYRIRRAIASGEFRIASRDSQLPSGIAQVVARSAAPGGNTQDGRSMSHTDQAAPRSRDTRQRTDRERG